MYFNVKHLSHLVLTCLAATCACGCLTTETLTRDNLVFDGAYEVRHGEGQPAEYFAIYRANNKGSRPSYLIKLPSAAKTDSASPLRIEVTASRLWKSRRVMPESSVLNEVSDGSPNSGRGWMRGNDGVRYERWQLVIVDSSVYQVRSQKPWSEQSKEFVVVLPRFVEPSLSSKLAHGIANLPLVPITLALDLVITPFYIFHVISN